MGESESNWKKFKPKQINTMVKWSKFNGKMALNCDKAPGIPKAFLEFL